MAKRTYHYEVEGLDGERFDFLSVLTPSAPYWLAEEAAEDFYNNHGGWEWSWPATLRILDGEADFGLWRVHMEMEPRFSSHLEPA